MVADTGVPPRGRALAVTGSIDASGSVGAALDARD